MTLDGNADAVEFCPTPPFTHVLAAATYTLQEAREGEHGPSRLGSLSLFTLGVEDAPHQLQQVHLLHTCGIFDIKWRPDFKQEDPPLLAHASADGSVTLYEMKVNDTFHLLELTRESISSSMCLSLDWDPHSNKHIAISHSDGRLSVLDVQESQMEVCQCSGTAHGFEAWSVTYDSWRPSVIYSGGDDCHFCCWDLRQGLFHPIFREKKTHQMGVCSIQTNPHQENIVATGSYDEYLRVWDVRMLEKPVVEKVLGLGGGVWKLKWNPHDKAFLVAACMHNGFMVVKVQGDEILLVMEYKQHESLAYGVDWFKGSSRSIVTNATQDHLVVKGDEYHSALNSSVPGEPLLATCSFYDRSLHIWKPDLYS